MKIGSFNVCLIENVSLEVPAILFGEFAVHSSLGHSGRPRGRIRDMRGMITVSHCPTGMSLDFFSDLMSAVYLAQELQNSVPEEIASCSDKNTLHSVLGDYYRRATLAVIGRNVGKETRT